MRRGCPLGRQPAQSPDSNYRGWEPSKSRRRIRRSAAHSRGESLGHFPAAGDQRPDARQRLCRGRARLHDGLRHHPAHQLRARRGRDDRRDGRVLRHHGARRGADRTAAACDPGRRRSGGDPRLHGSRIHARARRLPAAAQGAATGAAHHGHRPVHHPAARRDDHLEPQPIAFPQIITGNAHPPSPTIRTARRSPTCRS